MRELIRILLKLHHDRCDVPNKAGDELQLKQWLLSECQVRWPASTMDHVEKALEDVTKGTDIGNESEAKEGTTR